MTDWNMKVWGATVSSYEKFMRAFHKKKVVNPIPKDPIIEIDANLKLHIHGSDLKNIKSETEIDCTILLVSTLEDIKNTTEVINLMKDHTLISFMFLVCKEDTISALQTQIQTFLPEAIILFEKFYLDPHTMSHYAFNRSVLTHMCKYITDMKQKYSQNNENKKI